MLSNVVNIEFVKKTVYDKLAEKVNNIDTSGFVLRAKYNTDKSDLDKKKSVMQTKKFLILVEQQIITQKLMKLKKKLLIIIVINILLLQNLIGQKQKILLQD